jgi:hypothetical protein
MKAYRSSCRSHGMAAFGSAMPTNMKKTCNCRCCGKQTMEKEMGYCQSSRRHYPKCNETPELEMEADHLEQIYAMVKKPPKPSARSGSCRDIRRKKVLRLVTSRLGRPKTPSMDRWEVSLSDFQV